MESVAWFVAGVLAALVGVVAGTPVNAWGGLGAAAFTAILVTAVTKRLSTFAGAVLVVGAAGGLAVGAAGFAAVVALASVVVCAVGTYGLLRAWRAVTARSSARSGRRDRPGFDDLPPELLDVALTDSQVRGLVELAASDTDAFREEAALLTTGQRRQLRQALLARNDAE
ncbi:MAG: hypothetical protein ABGY41_06340 [Candidatus Poribacteria bacterium]